MDSSRCLARAVRAVQVALVFGVLAGVLHAAFRVGVNHYLGLGLYRLAALEACALLPRTALVAFCAALVAAVLAPLLRRPLAALGGRLRGRLPARLERLASSPWIGAGAGIVAGGVDRMGHPAAAAVAVLCLLGAGAGSLALETPVGQRGTNVLLITVDTLRADHLGSYGYVRPTSPHIDRLAERGVRVEQGVVQWPKTGPSFASIMTSSYGFENGVMRTTPLPIGRRPLLLAELLRNDGYRTAGIVTNGSVAKSLGFAQGFETYVEMWRETPYNRGASDRRDRVRAEHVADAAIDWLRREAGKGKFFLWVHFIDPHDPYDPPPPYDGMFVGDEHYREDRILELNDGWREYMHGLAARLVVDGRRNPDWYVAQYDAEIRYMDEHVGRLLAEVDALGLRDETAVVFTVDHGESLGDQGYWFAHGQLPYDACVRVPLILDLPPRFVPARRVVEEPVALIHLVPTLLELLGLPPHPEASGVSLMRFLAGDLGALPPYAFTESGYRWNYQRSVRDDRWKLIYVPSPRDQYDMRGQLYELYDLDNDPNELEDVSATHPEVVARLQQVLRGWMERSGRTLPPSAPAESALDEETRENLQALGYVD